MASAINNIRGAGWIVLSAVVATLMSMGVHDLAGAIPSAQTVFVRGVLGVVIASIFIFPRADYSIKTKRWKLHLLRGIFGVLAINFGFYSIMILPLATVTALFFTTPLFVTALSGPMLGEKVGPRRVAASVLGFLGAMLVIGYLPEPFHIKWLAPIFASLVFAVTLILGKKLSSTEKPGTILFYFTVVLSLGSLPPALVVWETPSANEWLIMVGISMASSMRNYLDIRGYAVGDAHFVAPFLYTRMIFMALVGYFVFQEVPTYSAIGGASLIVACTLYILHREMKNRKIEGKQWITPS